jgi:hypothetical protein
MKCRLKHNVIDQGKFHPRDSIIDDAILPDHLKTSEYVEYDLKNRGGKVLLLRDLSFTSPPRPASDGVMTSYPVRVGAGELVELAALPADTRKSLQEGTDYKTDWAFGEEKEVQRTADAEYLKQFQKEPEVPTGWRR